MTKVKIEDKYFVEEISSKDMTRREFLAYIFGDFVRGFFIVGSIFFDIILIPQLFSYIPESTFGNAFTVKIPLWNYSVSAILLTIITFTILFSIIYEIKLYLRIWGKVVRVPAAR